MKKLFLFIFLTIVSLTSTAQYRKLPLDTNHYWQQSLYRNVQPQPPTYCDYQLKVKKDSIRNGTTYKYIRSLNSFCNPNYLYAESALIREDTIQKLVLILVSNQEKIMYNFNKNVGDTAKIYSPLWGTMTTTLQTKDSILISDGFYHKRFNFSGLTIIEGVGCINGLLSPDPPFEINRQLLCIAQVYPTLTTIYNSGGVGQLCPIITNVPIETDMRKYISIFPNPTSDVLNIKTESVIPKYIQIKNILGQTIISINTITQDLSTINIKDLSQGVYFINVNLADKNISGHFIKN